MAAHLRAIHEAKCMRCGAKATHILHNTWNEPIGPYCRRHGAVAVKQHQRMEAKERSSR